MTGKPTPQPLSIEKIVAAIERARARLHRSLPDAVDIHDAAAQVLTAATAAQRRIQGMKSPFSIARIRAYISVVAIGLVGYWVYTDFFEARSVRIAVTTSDSRLLRDRAKRNNVRTIEFAGVTGSAEGLELLQAGRVDATIVQGGVPVPETFQQLGVVRHERVIYLRSPRPPDTPTLRMITFSEGQGSHLLGNRFFAHWQTEVEWLFDWGALCAGSTPVPAADGIFVVVDPADPTMRRGLQRAVAAGYGLHTPDLGAYEHHFDFLTRTEVRPAFYSQQPPIPTEPLHSYSVANYLVGRDSLTDRQRRDIQAAFDLSSADGEFGRSVLHTSGDSVVADLATLFDGLVNFALILAALLGIEILLHRRYLQELHNLVSEFSIMQSERDMLDIAEPKQRRENTLYLEGCADLLGLISILAAYYAHGDTALGFNGVAGEVHTRANQLKLNIQVKLMH